MVIGTCRSMAPEQIENRTIDPRTDLFSFGTLLYETFTGVSPFYDKSVIETLKRVCLHRQTPARETNPGLPEELSGLIDHLLQKDPALRPSDARSVLLTLEKIHARLRTRALPLRTLLSNLPPGRCPPQREQQRIGMHSSYTR